MSGADYRDGRLVSQKVAQVIDAIREYSNNELNVEWLPPEVRTAEQAAFRVVHNPPFGASYTVMVVKTEEEFDTRVLMRLIAGDQRNGTVTLSEIEAAEKAAEYVARRRAEDERAEEIDKMYHILKTKKNTYKVDDNLIIKDGIPFNAKGF